VVRAGKWLTGIGVAFLVLALLWLLFGVPALVRYPLDLDATPRYEGTFTLFVDPDTFAPLETPRTLPLTVTRHIDARGSESSFSEVLVAETIEIDAGGEFVSTQENHYVMDRRSIENVADDRAFAFSPENALDRAPAFRVNFPFGTDEKDYPVYKNEIGDSYTVTPDPAEPRGEVEGIDVINFVASAGPLPITAAYIAFLSETVPLPESLTITQLTPLLASVGIDVPGTLAALGPVIAPEDLEALSSLAAEPIDLVYLVTFSGQDSVEPKTGGIVEVRGVVETISATAAPDALPPITDILGRYPEVPEAQEALDGLTLLAESPIPLFRNEFSQTAESVTDIAGEVKDQKDLVTLAERTVPLVLAGLGVLCGVIGLALFFVKPKSKTEAESESQSGDAPVGT
jgi:Porin PorA